MEQDAMQAALDDMLNHEGPTDDPEKLAKIADSFGSLIYTTIQNATNATARSAQQADYRMGVSNLGHCRNLAVLMTKQTPFSDVRDKTAAFFGTVSSEPIELQIKEDHPDFLIQSELVVNLPNGASILGHSDIIIPFTAATEEFPQGVIDLKSKAELETIRKMGRNQQQQFQLDGYAAAAIDAGHLNPDEPIYLTNVFYDRSGKNQTPYPITTLYDPQGINTIDDWVNDVTYAVLNGEEGSKDQPREWCASYCEYFTVCRGNDTNVQGLIEDPEIIAAIDAYKEGGALESRGKKMKDAVKPILANVNGSTGTWSIKQTEVGATHVAYDRAAYMKTTITKVPQPKPKPKPKTEK